MYCYNNIIFSNNEPKLWPRFEGLSVQSPFVMRDLGRPKKARRKANGEVNTKKIKRIIQEQITCTTCGNFGHNKRTCIWNTVIDRMIPTWENKVVNLFCLFALLYLLFCYDNFYSSSYVMMIFRVKYTTFSCHISDIWFTPL